MAAAGEQQHQQQQQRDKGGNALTAMASALLRVLGDEFVLVEAVPMYQIQVLVFLLLFCFLGRRRCAQFFDASKFKDPPKINKISAKNGIE